LNYDYQIPAVQRTLEILRTSGVVANTSDTGTGKTYITSAALQQFGTRAFVIAPLSVHTVWHNVLTQYGVTAHGVINLEKLLRQRTPWYHDNIWHIPENTTVVMDEAHKGCCNPTSKTNTMLGRLKATQHPMVLQSATLADSPLKMRATGYLLGLHKFNPGSFYGWCRQHACSKSPWHGGLEFSKGPRGKIAMADIGRVLDPIMVRLRMADIPGFPECCTEANLYDLDKEYKDEVDKAYEEMDDALTEPGVNELVELQKARQRTELAKIALIEDLVNDFRSEGKSVVVFVNFTATIEALQKRMGGVKIYGKQTGLEREIAQRKFQENVETLCTANCEAGGLGISLHDLRQERPRVALITPPWSATTVRQVMGRIHRAGGTKALQIFVLAAGTVEERIHAALKRKLGNLAALNDDDMR